VYYDIQKIFRRTNTAVTRLESVTRSPIYADFSETLSGLSSIRAYGLQHQFADKLEKAVDCNTVPLILSSQAGYWLGIRLDAMGALVTFFVAFFAVACDTFLSPYVGRDFISPGYLALGLNYSFSLTAALKYCIRIMAQLEAQMNSIERVKYYSEEVEQEKGVSVASNASGSFAIEPSPTGSDPVTVVPDAWPIRGEIVAEDLSMRYREGPLVLKGLSFHVDAGEKVGVAGRTGYVFGTLLSSLVKKQSIEHIFIINCVLYCVISSYSYYSLRCIVISCVLFLGLARAA
jgi:ABC-type multidrug transport system fused ATPase/permease subunit